MSSKALSGNMIFVISSFLFRLKQPKTLKCEKQQHHVVMILMSLVPSLINITMIILCKTLVLLELCQGTNGITVIIFYPVVKIIDRQWKISLFLHKAKKEYIFCILQL